MATAAAGRSVVGPQQQQPQQQRRPQLPPQHQQEQAKDGAESGDEHEPDFKDLNETGSRLGESRRFFSSVPRVSLGPILRHHTPIFQGNALAERLPTLSPSGHSAPSTVTAPAHPEPSRVGNRRRTQNPCRCPLLSLVRRAAGARVAPTANAPRHPSVHGCGPTLERLFEPTKYCDPRSGALAGQRSDASAEGCAPPSGPSRQARWFALSACLYAMPLFAWVVK